MHLNNIHYEEKKATHLRRIWQTFIDNPLALVGLWAIACLILLTLLTPFIAPFSPEAQNSQAILMPPSWHEHGSVEYFFGTDDLGRDIFSRILHGVQLTFGMSLVIVFAALFIGFIIGAISGMMTGLKSSILGHLFDALLSIPSLLMAILVVAVIGPGLTNVFWAVGIAMVPQFIRAIHQAVHEELQKDYVTAAKLDGANSLQIFWYVIMPNVWDILIIQVTMAISAAILDIAALGFLKLGAQAPSPEWGAMMAQGLDNLLLAPWTITIPGVAILITVLSINLVGDGLRSALVPKRN
ncbi:ABC transporter permease subunit [Shewanella intestini]|uniref:ABC transporter permease subunit n=1 Tax=Shewanella intestini TaxID=2017544 RepID=A0ABS5I5I5_9GAMM|nr:MULTISPECIES: ABC transporter permease subunit [Shewanella]MBR9729266.1 ABC transporter permease subunit [Shewanella intestini]MRG35411.1 ABC transporter permease subunit [Shewanella sp. XMDDZSB0408]